MSEQHTFSEALEDTLEQLKKTTWAEAKELEQWFAESRKEIAAIPQRGEEFLSVDIRIRSETVPTTVPTTVAW